MLTIILAAIGLSLACVLIHHEVLSHLDRKRGMAPRRDGFKVALGLIGALLAHVVEIMLFAAAYIVLSHMEGMGRIVGETGHEIRDHIYFSFSTFSTVGYGDLVPVGPIRILVGVESLLGLVLITWTASFLFLEMQMRWSIGNGKVK